MAEDAAPQAIDQHPHVKAAMYLPILVGSDDDEIIFHELEKMRSILEEAILQTRSMPFENRPQLPRILLSKRNRAVVRTLNPTLVTYLKTSRDLCETDSTDFAVLLPMAGHANRQSSTITAWEKKPRTMSQSVYAPTMDKDDEIKGEFYKELTNVLTKIHPTEQLLLLGDFNARVGHDCDA
ncbi:unnamed protein product [Parnassius apollo]|uniref:(apollo) hypothetical protein n=1 Tax=Parnassius apollo TaxID=110799 RepID=A0A8S3X5X5_PARAO|nr:unnamed protein product [Parnassius apollo]